MKWAARLTVFQRNPYQIGGIPREVTKRIVVASIGRGKPPSRWPRSFNDDFIAEHGYHPRDRYKLKDVVSSILARHPVLSNLEGFVKCRSLSEAEERTVIEYCIAKQAEYPDASAWSKAHDLFIYLIDTGVRLREATLVDWGAIDMRERYIDNYNFKTKKEVFVPISDRLFEVLSLLQNQPQPFVSMDRAIKNLRRAMTECCPSSPRVLATQGKATIHSCRDTYATRMLNNGMRLEEVSHLLGHATIVQTQKYAKFAKKEVADKARQMLNARKVA